jgi:signal transduction histidine kinase
MLDRIRRRLTMGYVGILALILILFGLIVVVSFSRQVTAQQDQLLEEKARSEVESVVDGGRYGGIKATTESDIAVVAIPPDGSTGEVLDLGDSSSSLGLPFSGLARKAVQERAPIKRTVRSPEGPVRVVSIPLFGSYGSVVAVVQAAQPRQVVWETVNRLVFVLLPVGLGALLLSAIGGLFMSRRAMRPVQDAFDRQRTFIADASHELKTPLTLIRANTEVLSRSLSDDEDRELADDLIAETDRMNALLSDLLTLARLDAGKLTVKREPFDLANIIAETVERFTTRASAEGKALEVRLGDSKIPARGDAVRTEQILAALLDNALRFTPPGGLVTLEGRSRDGRAEASVTDTGPGIPAEHLPLIFDRFYRAEAARTREGGGTGLGLSIALSLASAQGGDLKAANAPNRGASFTLGLPAGA